ncbi:MAG: phosphoribosylformylglycinamidine synthase subunit PurQ, partial [Pontimonas sp.]|nr:phosphoribosylformylglycinamidine synthase subunit PurQ [Pontimonas sp.]
ASGYELHQEIVIPLKNGEGGFIADDESLKRIEGESLVAFRYLEVNPNGSAHDIAGLRNETGRIVGLMPHPEHAVEAGFGPDTDVAMKSGTDGLAMFQSVLTQVVNA